MPKYTVDEEEMEDYFDSPEEEAEFQERIANATRQDGVISFYEKADTTQFIEEKLGPTIQLVLQQLRAMGATQLLISYDGGGDEGYADFTEARTPKGNFDFQATIEILKQGPLGEEQPERYSRYSPEEEAHFTRADYAKDALELLAYELASWLLGGGYGTGEFPLEGAFTADLETNTLTDLEPEEG